MLSKTARPLSSRPVAGQEGPIAMTSQRPPRISLVVPSKNSAQTLPACLNSARNLLQQGLLDEIVLVDDGSTDSTSVIAASYGTDIKLIQTGGRGPAAARNAGWRAAGGDWIWFIDSDCVAQPDSLRLLWQCAMHTDEHFPSIANPSGRVAGVGGSYTNLNHQSLLSEWIQAEIAARHARMPCSVEFLGSYNVLYSREALLEVGGFDERHFPMPSAEDNDLAYRLRARGYRLQFNARSTVGHFHPTHWRRYLRTQARHGYYRMILYSRHPARMTGDSYSGIIDYPQPVLALALLPAIGIGAWYRSGVPAFVVLTLLLLCLLPMTWQVFRQRGKLVDLGFCGLSFLRAFARCGGLVAGTLELARRQLRRCLWFTSSATTKHKQPV
jgi:glycosyltransferase involved in cell wall biosynthesis